MGVVSVLEEEEEEEEEIVVVASLAVIILSTSVGVQSLEDENSRRRTHRNVLLATCVLATDDGVDMICIY